MRDFSLGLRLQCVIPVCIISSLHFFLKKFAFCSSVGAGLLICQPSKMLLVKSIFFCDQGSDDLIKAFGRGKFVCSYYPQLFMDCLFQYRYFGLEIYFWVQFRGGSGTTYFAISLLISRIRFSNAVVIQSAIEACECMFAGLIMLYFHYLTIRLHSFVPFQGISSQRKITGKSA